MSSVATMRSLMGRGLGATVTQDINTSIVTSGAAIAGAASAGLLTAVGITAAAVPIIGPIVAGITLLISAFGVGQGCGSSCTESTQVVNQVIPLMQQNLAAAQQQLQANGGCLTSAEQQQCVSNFNTLWQQIVQGCTQVGGAGGSQCIADRQPGGKYDCFVTLLDPIQAMPVCAATSAAAGTAPVSSVDGISSNVLIGGALIAAAILLFK